jgi:hypothetical protein
MRSQALYLASLALLPWSWFPPFPFLHEHAQWSDVVFALAALAWVVHCIRFREWPRPQWIHAAMVLYLVWAALSLLVASPVREVGAMKLLGMAELCALSFITAEMAARPGMRCAIAWAVAITSLLTVLAALIGLALFYAGVTTRLVGTYGDLVPSTRYARVQAGLYHPNLLASYCIFAFAVVSSGEASLPRGLRRVVQFGLTLVSLLTVSRAVFGLGLVWAIASARTPFQRRLVAIFAAVSVAAIGALSVWNLSLDPAAPLATRILGAESASRWETMTSSLHTLEAHPLFGSGLGTSPGMYRGMPFDAHLTPLNIAATMGLPGLVAFGFIPILLWRNRRQPMDLALWGGLAGLALDSLASDVEEFRHVWVLFGLLDGGSQNLQRFSDGCARALAGRLSAAITVCQREAPARLCLRGRRRTNWVARN